VDWDLAIKRNGEALEGIIAGLFAMLELAGGVTVSRIPQSLHSAVRRILWPAESAVRRLIVIAARGLVVKLASPRPMSRPMPAKPIGNGLGGSRPPAFKLFDARKNFAPHSRKFMRNPPRIHVLGGGDPFSPHDPRVAVLWQARPPVADAAPLPSDGLINAVPLTRRLAALKLALDDLPRQARRMARWRARREAMPNPKFRSPLRLGRAPGSRRKPTHLVDEILTECHALAWDALKPDTS
jgi:hypothetical protein